MGFRKSNELIAVMQRLMVAIQSGDTATARGLIANEPETLLVGNRGEWLYGLEAHEVIAAQLSVMPEYERTIHSLEAYEDGAIGWGAAKHTVTFPNGVRVRGRTTAVFRLENGVWRVVQWHASSPVADADDWFDVDVPRTLSDLVDSLGDDLDSSLTARFNTRHVTLLISDIEDSTRYGVEFGDALWSDVIRRHFDRLGRIADVHRGLIVKTMGDGVLMAFDTPADAARAALAIQDSVIEHRDVGEYRVRIGIHLGPAVHSDDDYFGYTVTKTARLTSAASGGEILVSKQVAEAIDELEDLSAGRPRALSLKGLPGTHAAYPLTRAQPPQSR
jgi:class 3 adenylate cyclase